MPFNALLLLDTFVLGGLVALILVDQILQMIRDRLTTIEGQQNVAAAQGYLVPLWVFYIGITLILVLITVAAYVRGRTRPSAIAELD